MTIVATFSIEKNPVLIGDLLLSSFKDGKNYESFNIPTCEDVNSIVPDVLWRIVSGLQSKIILVNSRFALAWAGSEIAARAVLVDIRSIIVGEFTFSDIYKFIDGIDYLGTQELYLTGIVLEKVDSGVAVIKFGWDHEKKWDSYKFETKVFGEVYAGGSGCDDLEALLKNHHGASKASCEINSTENAILTTLSVLGHLTGQQIRMSQGFSSMYGGGYELVTILDGKLKKIDDITYHFWEITTDSTKDNFKIRFHNTLKYTYFDDCLAIRKVRIFEEGGRGEIIDEIFVLPSGFHKLNDNAKHEIRKNYTPPDLNSKFSVIYLHVPNDRSPDDVVSFVYYSENKKLAVEYVFGDDYVDIVLSEDLRKKIFSTIDKLKTWP